MRSIKEGDKVEVWWTSCETKMEGVVENTPQNTGDLWYIKDDKGNIHAINPYCSNLECIIKTKDKNQIGGVYGRDKSRRIDN